MRDGIRLYADVYRPAAGGNYPVVVTRTPYLKHTDRFVERARYFAETGYAYVIQDVRGRGDSEGEFYPFFNEINDGYDSLTWAAEQSWSNGALGTIGASYGAWTQWLCATANPPNLVTMIAEASPPDFFRCLPYQKGAFSLPMLSWLVQLDGRGDRDITSIDWDELLKQRPLASLDLRCGHRIRAWQDWLEHDREDPYWASIAFSRRFDHVSLPVFHISGWYDDVLIGALSNYKGLIAASKASRAFQKLLIGPWPHRINTTSKFGDIDFGENGIVDLFDLQRQWFDYWLKQSHNDVLNQPPVRFYEMGSGTWKDGFAWPPQGLELAPLYLHSRGHANTRNGDGTLDYHLPGSEPTDEYVYDPEDPVPFLKDPGWIQLGGPDNYSAVEKRVDVLVYSTEPLEKEIQITGPLIVKLYASSTALDTDFTAKLLDAMPNGYVLRLNDGIVRARFRSSLSHPTSIRPGVVYEYTIDCWATSYLFKKGHRIRLEVSSSAFPKFDPNLNTGGPIATDTSCVKVLQRVFHTREYPSHLLLPTTK